PRGDHAGDRSRRFAALRQRRRPHRGGRLALPVGRHRTRQRPRDGRRSAAHPGRRQGRRTARGSAAPQARHATSFVLEREDILGMISRKEPNMAEHELEKIARALVAPGRRILCADESDGTIKKRFDSIDVESTEESRRAYRDMLFTTPGAADHISGVILFDETIRQSSADGTPFPALLEGKGVIPGIKVDKGAKPLALAEGEPITQGLDGVRDRLNEYREWGAKFAKWRATYSISESLPSEYCVWTNAHALARYAALCQEAGIVPIFEPEVLQDGTHTIEESAKATGRVLQAVYTELHDQRIERPGTLLNTNMVLSGDAASNRAGADEVADRTLEVLYKHVPASVPGIVFLSG